MNLGGYIFIYIPSQKCNKIEKYLKCVRRQCIVLASTMGDNTTNRLVCGYQDQNLFLSKMANVMLMPIPADLDFSTSRWFFLTLTDDSFNHQDIFFNHQDLFFNHQDIFLKEQEVITKRL